MKRWMKVALTAAICSMMTGGMMAYGQQAEARAESLGDNCGTGGADHRIGRPLSLAEKREYEAAALPGYDAEAACEKLDDAQARLVRLMDDYHGEPLGRFKITAYTAGYESCGKLPDDPLYGITATGKRVRENHTIASDWDVLPPGTKVRIEGLTHIYTVEDRGGAVRGKHIDLYIEDLDEALQWGVREREVYLVE